MDFTCPKCAEIIPPDTRKCRFCEEWVNPPVVGESPQVDQRASDAVSRGTTGFVIALIGLVGGFLCALPIVLCPIGWIIAAGVNTRLRELGRPPHGLATAGVVLGIIGTVMLFIGGAILMLVVFAAAASPDGAMR